MNDLLTNAHSSPGNGQQFTIVDTPIIEAFRYGWLCEIQEPTVIMQPGVLVGLNSLFETKGSIKLATGEIVQRHPDTMIVITTNVDYEGCRGLNQSIISRMNLVLNINLPDPGVMAQRVMNVTGFDDEDELRVMIDTLSQIKDYCKNRGITDGTCDMRSLFDWAISAQISGNIYESALYTVVPKATSDEDEQVSIITTILDNAYPQGLKSRKTA